MTPAASLNARVDRIMNLLLPNESRSDRWFALRDCVWLEVNNAILEGATVELKKLTRQVESPQ